MNRTRQFVWIAASIVLGLGLGMLVARHQPQPVEEEKTVSLPPTPPAPVLAQPKPEIEPVAAPAPVAKPAITLWPEGMDFRSSRFDLAKAARHFLEQAEKNPEAFAALLAENLRKMPPDVMEAALWALAPHDPEGAAAAAAKVPGFVVREKIALAVARALPLDQADKAGELASKMKLGIEARRQFLGGVAQRRAAADPAWAAGHLRESKPGGRTDLFVIKGLAEAGMKPLQTALKDLPAGRLPPDMVGEALAHAAQGDVASAMKNLDTLAKTPVERAHAVNRLMALMDWKGVASPAEYEVLAKAVSQTNRPVDSSPQVAHWNQMMLAKMALDTGHTEKALAVIDAMPPGSWQNQAETAAALALNKNDWNKAFAWVAERQGNPGADAQGELGFFISQWSRDAPDGMSRHLTQHPDGPGSRQMLNSLNTRYEQLGASAYAQWKKGLPASLAAQLPPQR